MICFEVWPLIGGMVGALALIVLIGWYGVRAGNLEWGRFISAMTMFLIIVVLGLWIGYSWTSFFMYYVIGG